MASQPFPNLRRWPRQLLRAPQVDHRQVGRLVGQRNPLLALTNAEKQARWRERRNALARTNPEVAEQALLQAGQRGVDPRKHARSRPMGLNIRWFSHGVLSRSMNEGSSAINERQSAESCFYAPVLNTLR